MSGEVTSPGVMPVDPKARVVTSTQDMRPVTRDPPSWVACLVTLPSATPRTGENLSVPDLRIQASDSLGRSEQKIKTPAVGVSL